jgi:hypothetical protein
LKEAFTKEPVLVSFNPAQPIIFETDISDYSISTCLNQKSNQGKQYTVAYYSRKITPAELNYNIYNKELLAIVETASYWRYYLEGARYTVSVFTDYKNLIYFTTTKQLTQRQVR